MQWKILFAILFFIIGTLVTIEVLFDRFLFRSIDVFRTYIEIDSCLDRGGCWDYRYNICRKEEPDAQALCDTSRGKDEIGL